MIFYNNTILLYSARTNLSFKNKIEIDNFLFYFLRDKRKILEYTFKLLINNKEYKYSYN
jgi:hypothetical protein